MIPLEKINTRNCKYSVAVRQWNQPELIHPHWMYNFMCHQGSQNRPFNFDFIGIIKRRITKQTETKIQDKQKITCAMFVAEIFQYFGLFDPQYNISLLLPSDYLGKKLPYGRHGIELMEPVLIDGIE
jgi:hypothetical protein